jgi:hypothetical protein
MKKVKINGVIYGVRDGEVIVCGVVDKNYPANIRIEHEVQGKPVVQIRSGAFEFRDFRSIELPSTINTISKGAFFACHFLERVSEYQVDTSSYKLTPTLNKIHPWVFIDESAFSNCENLKTVEFKKPFRYVYASAFEDCVMLENMYVLLGTIKKDAFKNCGALKEIYLGDNAHLSNDSIEKSGISKLIVKDNLSYTTLMGKHMQANHVRICCEASSPVAELAYLGFEIETI